MTDSEKLAELRKAFHLAVVCLCDGDAASLAEFFPPESTASTALQELEAHIADFSDTTTLEDYFKRMMEL